MKKPVKKTCAYCQGHGWSKEMFDHFGWMVSKPSGMFSEPVYRCPYCDGPAGSEVNERIKRTDTNPQIKKK